MKEAYHIVDTVIPANQDFNLLKDKGLSYIQKVSGNEWTNLNPSDPGVTILDQLCYALTELGYCNDFPVEDILTDKAGNIDFDNQFYLSDEILTTAPVTFNDYIKLILDCIDGVDNAVIIKTTSDLSFLNAVYNVFLHIDHNITVEEDIALIKNKTYRLLNENRSLGELFLPPTQLIEKKYKIHGEIVITDEKLLAKVLIEIQRALRHYIFPKAKQFGYNNLIDKGQSTNTIFNGPNLKGGWIEDEDLNTKRDSISSADLNNLMATIPGVVGIPALQFKTNVVAKPDELIVIDIIDSLTNPENSLTISAHGQTISNQKITTIYNSIAPIKNSKTKKQSVSTINRVPDLPKGNYRDINSYYSIQNTFPEIFPVGPNSITNNASDYKIAQSLQLKGYLTLFDQILANQFSQLANISRLFSFKNAITACPSDLENYIAQQDVLNEDSSKYPAPYLTFSPTYFYQSLYDIPHIKPLLKDNNALEFDLEIEPKHITEEKGWKSFKNDPYNRYIYGLKQFMEDDTINFTRRNEILDHLLARHGESPLLLDTYINGSKYTANPIQDKLIYKSLYLQNLELLSYYRGKAYDYLKAAFVEPILIDLIVITIPFQWKPSNSLFELHKQLQNGYSTDFIFDSTIEDETQKLQRHNFIDYSAIELKYSMLFGLSVQYGDFIVENFNNSTSFNTFLELEMSAWMIQQRKGIICIETDLLLKDATCHFIIEEKFGNRQWTSLNSMTCGDVNGIINDLNTINHASLLKNLDEGWLLINDVKYDVLKTELKYCDVEFLSSMKPMDPVLESSFKIIWKNGKSVNVNSDFFKNTLHVFFPDFIPQFSPPSINGHKFTSPAFKSRTEVFFENELPIEMCPKLYILPANDLMELIQLFTSWHNSLRHSNDDENKQKQIEDAALKLTAQIYKLKDSIL